MKRMIVWEPGCQIADGMALLDMVTGYLLRHDLITDREAVAEAVMRREDLGNDLVAPNVAIPHAQNPAVKQTVLLLVKLDHALHDWSEGSAVDRFIFSLIPPNPSIDDVSELKEFYSSVADDRVMQKLSSGNQREIRTIFTSRRKTSVDSLSLNAILDRNTILTDVKAKTKDDVIALLSQRLHEQGYIASVKDFVRAVNQREQEGATGIGEHVAIPHGRADTVTHNGVAIAVLDHEIRWESLDDTGAKVVVLLAVGADGEGSNEHLRILSLFARKLGKSKVIEALLRAETVDDVIATFAD